MARVEYTLEKAGNEELVDSRLQYMRTKNNYTHAGVSRRVSSRCNHGHNSNGFKDNGNNNCDYCH